MSSLVRHCAFCLQSVAEKEIKLCSRCHKRAYCSKECQVADWTTKKGGQGHKTWCPLQCGEEDLDWEVSPVPGKGLGLIAKHLIPAKYRIIVDGCRSRSCPGIDDLMPLNGTKEEKFRLNCLGGEEGEESVLCLRISRANHQCDANAEHIYDETFKVKILFSIKEIQEGEEICINYQPYNDISKNMSAETSRCILQAKWGITCPQDCFCYNKEIATLIKESKELDEDILRLAAQATPRHVDAALRNVDKLLKNHDILNSAWNNKKRTLYDGFQIAIMRRKTLKQGEGYVRQAYDIACSVTCPNSAQALRFETYIRDMSNHRNYLIME